MDGQSVHFVMTDIGKQTLPPVKCRCLCEHCNQLLAKTTYWEHQRICFDNSVPEDDEHVHIDSDYELQITVDMGIGVMKDYDNNELNDCVCISNIQGIVHE